MPPVTLKLFFCLIVILKCQFLNDGCQLWPQISKLFLNQFSKFLWLSYSKFQGLLKNGQKFLCTCSITRDNNKKQRRVNIVGHPVQSVHEARGKVSMHTLWIQIYSNRNTSNEIKHLCNSQSVPIDAWNNWYLLVIDAHLWC